MVCEVNYDDYLANSAPGVNAYETTIGYQCDPEFCDFDGDVEVTVERGYGAGTCPECGTDFELEVLR